MASAGLPDAAAAPVVAVLGRGARLPRGWELALANLSPGGGRALVRCGRGYGFLDAAAESAAARAARGGDPDAPPVLAWGPPPGCEAGAEYEADLTLLSITPSAQVGIGGADGDVIRVTLIEGDTWETPRPPFEVAATITARVPASSGVPGKGEAYWATPPGAPLVATMGSGALPTGLEDALATVTRGETAVVSVPAGRCGGGGLGLPCPPTGAARVEFEACLVRMVQVRDLVGDGSVTKRRVVDGRGEFPADCPLDDNAVRVHVRAVALAEGEGASKEGGAACWDTREADGGTGAVPPSPSSSSAPPLEFIIGTGAVPDAVDLAVRLMTPGERAVVVSDAGHAWDGGRTDRPRACPQGARVEFTIDLVDYDRTAAGGGPDADPVALLARAGELRAQGNALFAQASAAAGAAPASGGGEAAPPLSTASGPTPADLAMRRAVEKWRRAAHMLSNTLDFVGADEATAAGAAAGRAAAHANLALASLRADKAGEAIAWADKALKDEPGHAKALLRKGTACASLGRWAEAEACFDEAAAADPTAADEARWEKARAGARKAEEEARQQREMRNFFGRAK